MRGSALDDAARNGGDGGGAAAGPRVPVPPARPFLETFGANVKETFLPDDPFRVVRRERGCARRAMAVLRYVFPIFEWAPAYTLGTLKSDLVAGITIASLAIPQGISYANLAYLPSIHGLCKPLLNNTISEIKLYSNTYMHARTCVEYAGYCAID
ncbi:hypothetical protein ABZP36_019380 [Zizania latifolia]